MHAFDATDQLGKVWNAVYYKKLRIGAYRVMYVVEDDIITIERVDLMI